MAGSALLDQAFATEDFFTSLGAFDAIMAMPSSFWGRLRGRFDLAALTAATIAHCSQKPLIVAPWRVQGRWHKQAHRTRKERELGGSVFKAARWGAQDLWRGFAGNKEQQRLRVLLVDDIVTTGQSLTSFMGLFTDVDFRIVTLASALKQDKTPAGHFR